MQRVRLVSCLSFKTLDEGERCLIPSLLCCSCGEVVNKREQFNDLSIDLPRRKKTLPLRSIQDSLDLFFRVSHWSRHPDAPPPCWIKNDQQGQRSALISLVCAMRLKQKKHCSILVCSLQTERAFVRRHKK